MTYSPFLLETLGSSRFCVTCAFSRLCSSIMPSALSQFPVIYIYSGFPSVHGHFYSYCTATPILLSDVTATPLSPRRLCPKSYMIASPRGTGVPHSGQRCRCLLSSGEMQCRPGGGQELSFFPESRTAQCCLHRRVAHVLWQVPGTHAPPGVCLPRMLPLPGALPCSPKPLQCPQTRMCLLELSLDPSSFLTEAGKGPPPSLGGKLCYMGTGTGLPGHTQSHRDFSGITFLCFMFAFLVCAQFPGPAKESRAERVMEEVEAKSWRSHTLTTAPPAGSHCPWGTLVLTSLVTNYVLIQGNPWMRFAQLGLPGPVSWACQSRSGTVESYRERRLYSRYDASLHLVYWYEGTLAFLIPFISISQNPLSTCTALRATGSFPRIPPQFHYIPGRYTAQVSPCCNPEQTKTHEAARDQRHMMNELYNSS